MTTGPRSSPVYNSRERGARIDRKLADIEQKPATAIKIKQETRFAPRTLIFAVMGAAPVFFAAGVAFTKFSAG
ncbi:hypothetical protein [Sphingomonas sp.]|uniref:hypothetical protein n=1 Tax=Sphingomonas sp. TaxID=28214 RepID=UPI003CC5380B